MSLSLWMLLAFACWTLAILIVGVGMRRWLLIFQGREALTGFPGDAPHGSPAYRRATRAHANCVENLPVFAAIVVAAVLSGHDSQQIGVLAAVTVAARIAQSSIHMLIPESNGMIAARFSCFTVQLITMISMVVILAGQAAQA